MSALVISLDFELFWGVAASKSIENYGKNIIAEWQVIPAMLKLFKKYNIQASWAMVGMAMCKDYKQWCDIQPSIKPTYSNERYSTYLLAKQARDFPKLFFGRPLVEQILAANGQELSSHTYSHFYCGESKTIVEQFVADLKCAQTIFDEYKVKPTSIIFPRNQIRNEYLNVLLDAGFTAYRGNKDHWLYRDGHLGSAPIGKLKRLLCVADAYLPLTKNHISMPPNEATANQLMNIPACMFMRPFLDRPIIDELHLHRIKNGMQEAAKANSVFHLWWHPHNFGQNTETNLMNLEKLLNYYCLLNQQYGMKSLSMKNLYNSCKKIKNPLTTKTNIISSQYITPR